MAIRPPLTESRQDIWNHFLGNPVTVTTDYTAGTKQVILASGSITITLPPAKNAPVPYLIKNIGSVTINIALEDSNDLIEGSLGATVQTTLQGAVWASDGESGWWVLGLYP